MHCGSWPYSAWSGAADEQVELLVGAAELEIGLQGHRVVALHQRIEEFVDADRRARLESLGEVVALHHPRHGVAGGELDHPAGAERVAPLGVVTNLRLGSVEDQARLGLIGLSVGLDLLAGQRRPGGVAARRVADHGREVADQENDRVAEVLKLAQLVQYDRMAEMNVGRGRIEAQFDPQWHARCFRPHQFGHPVGLGQQLAAAPLRDRQRRDTASLTGIAGPAGTATEDTDIGRLRRKGHRKGPVYSAAASYSAASNHPTRPTGSPRF